MYALFDEILINYLLNALQINIFNGAAHGKIYASDLTDSIFLVTLCFHVYAKRKRC